MDVSLFIYIYNSSLSKASEHDLEKPVPTKHSQIFLSILWPSHCVYSAMNCLSAGFFFSPFSPKSNPILDSAFQTSLYIYTSTMYGSQEGAFSIGRFFVSFLPHLQQAACSVHLLLSRWGWKMDQKCSFLFWGGGLEDESNIDVFFLSSKFVCFLHAESMLVDGYAVSILRFQSTAAKDRFDMLLWGMEVQWLFSGWWILIGDDKCADSESCIKVSQLGIQLKLHRRRFLSP